MKKLELLGVYDDRVDGKFRLPNVYQLMGDEIELTFRDLAKPEDGFSLNFDLHGNMGINALVSALLRHKKGLPDWPLNAENVQKPKHVTFDENVSVYKERLRLEQPGIYADLNPDRVNTIMSEVETEIVQKQLSEKQAKKLLMRMLKSVHVLMRCENAKYRSEASIQKLSDDKETRQTLCRQEKSKLTDNYLRVISACQNKITYLSDATEIHIKHPGWFEREDLRTFLRSVLALMPNLEIIKVPEVLEVPEVPGDDPYADCTSYWVSIWTKSIKLQIIANNQIATEVSLGEVPPRPALNKRKTLVNDDEIESSFSTSSSSSGNCQNSESRDQEGNDSFMLEENIWEGSDEDRSKEVSYNERLKAGLTMGVGVLAVAAVVVHSARNKTVTVEHVSRVVNHLHDVQSQLTRAASYVPFLPTAMRIAGAVANSTIKPVAEKIGVLKK